MGEAQQQMLYSWFPISDPENLSRKLMCSNSIHRDLIFHKQVSQKLGWLKWDMSENNTEQGITLQNGLIFYTNLKTPKPADH